MKKNLTIALFVLFILSGIRFFTQDALIKESRPSGSISAKRVEGIATKARGISKLHYECDAKGDENKISRAIRIRKI